VAGNPSGGESIASVASGTIVVADDDRITRNLLGQMLERHGFRVELCEDGQAAVERVARGGVDLVLLDILMPRLTGLEACRLLKSMTHEAFLPVVLVTVKTDTASRVEGLRIGADDYVCKPFDEEELLARVHAMLRIKRLHDQVADARAKLERLSVYDDLTGLYNYRHLNTRLSEEFKRAERYHDPLACVVIDIDRLQAVNDALGRAVGNEVIRVVARLVKGAVREVDVVSRFGGDEILVILPSTHFAGSVTVAERIWRECEASPDLAALSPASANPAANAADGKHRITLSIGVALFPSRDVRNKDTLLRSADAALHQAKLDGGNRICVFQQQGCIYTPMVQDDSAPISEAASTVRNFDRNAGDAPVPSARPTDRAAAPVSRRGSA
jgi:diguanylate cyclase (GGDEF)-like protein